MQNKISKEEVKNMFVSDDFFSRGHLILKLRQSILTLLGWGGVILPFIWLLFPFIYPEKAKEWNFLVYSEEVIAFNFILLFLSIVVLFITVSFLLLTIWNNHRYKNVLQKRKVIDEENIEKNKEAINKFYDRRFGRKDFRENVRFYTIPSEKNIEVNEINDLYIKGGE